MSEAELHMMRARLRGGVLNAAKRGALKIPLSVGLVYNPLSQVVLGPDPQVQNECGCCSTPWHPNGSGARDNAHFLDENLLFPYRPPGWMAEGRAVFEAADDRAGAERAAQPTICSRALSPTDAPAAVGVPAAVSS